MNDLFLKLPIYLYIMATVFLFQYIRKGYLKNISMQIFLNIKKYKNILLACFFMLLFCIFCLDKKITLCFKIHKFLIFDRISNFGNFLGNGRFLFASIGTIIVVYLILEKTNSKFYNCLKISLISGAYAGIVNLVIKFFIERQRPFVQYNPLHFFDYKYAILHHQFSTFNYLSMGSGHTILITAVVVPFIIYYRNKFSRLIFAALPIIVGFSRVYTQNHWFSDVFFGFVFGIIFGLSCYQINKERMK